MKFEVVLYEVSDHVATITLNRPDRLNAIVAEMGEQLRAAFQEAQRDTEVRCVILTGAGAGFCSGDDIVEFWGNTEMMNEALQQLREPRPEQSRLDLLLFDKPVIAAVNGVAYGNGLDFALMSDIRLASTTAKFGDLRIRWGAVADFTVLLRLPQLVGQSHASELLFTADKIDAATAKEIGLVSRVYPPDELMPAARALAAKIAAQPPLALRYMKEGVRKGLQSPSLLEDMHAFVNNAVAYLFTTEDHKEAVQAFLEHRDPIFKGC
jgi:enoyl-CoA hydratase/carnithine racemase